MAWKPRSPQSFPAHFARTMIEAVTHCDRPIPFGSYRTEKEAKIVAERFRHYRWCLRDQPTIQPSLTNLELDYQFRLSKEQSHAWHVLYITASVDRVRAMETLNPHLQPLIAGIE